MNDTATNREIIIVDHLLSNYAGNEAWYGVAWRYADDDLTQAERVAQGILPIDIDTQAILYRTLPKRYREYTFGTLEVNNDNQQAVTAAKNHDHTRNLYLWGNAGNGKTHLAVATAQIASEIRRVSFWNTATLFSNLRQAAIGAADWPDLTRVDLLVIDDIGKVKPTDFIFQELYRVLEERWSNERGTIFTANHRPSEAVRRIVDDAESQGAILSRFGSGTVVEVKGSDKRLTQAHAYRKDAEAS